MTCLFTTTSYYRKRGQASNAKPLACIDFIDPSSNCHETVTIGKNDLMQQAGLQKSIARAGRKDYKQARYSIRFQEENA
jgi:hypothetical protein